jgi:RND family efflux transporter MFP subunit
MKQLFGQGAIAQAQLDVAQTQYDVAKAQHDSAKQNLSLVEEGARSEDVRAAETQVTQANEALRTAKANAAQNALRQEDIRSAEAGVAQAKAQLAIVQEQLANTSIVSPISGIVSMRSTEPGQMAIPGVPLMQIVNVGSVFFQASVSETVVAKVKPGQTAAVSVDAFTGSSFMGTVERVYPAASTDTRSFNVRVKIPNPESKLRPGMFTRGSIITGGSSGAVLVPLDAVEERQGSNIVLIVNKGKAKMVTINKGLSNSEFVEALPPCDLRPGDRVVTSGHENLEEGTRVLLSEKTAR